MVKFRTDVSRGYFLGVSPPKNPCPTECLMNNFSMRWGRFDTTLLQHDLRWNSKKWGYADPKYCLKILKWNSNYGQPSRLWQMVVPTQRPQRLQKEARGNATPRWSLYDGGWEPGEPRGNLCFWRSWYIMTKTSFHQNDFHGINDMYIYICINIWDMLPTC